MEDFQMEFFTGLGILVFLIYLVKFLKFLKYIFPDTWSPQPKTFFCSMGEWAVVTGGSDGIGKAYALELAKRGLNIILISRTLEKLKNVAAEIEQSTGRRVKIIQVDFTKKDIYQRIQENLRDLEIGVVVNNVGMLFHNVPCRFLENNEDPYQDQSNLIHCNITSVVKMTQMILPQMVERSKGLIINVSSSVGTFPCPLYSMYSASKSFMLNFSRGLHAEYESKGIIIQCVAPFGVSTNMSASTKSSLPMMDPGDFARESLKYVSFGDMTFGCLAHEIQGFILSRIPLWIMHTDKAQEKMLTCLKAYS
ncbi:testosterone 17-beta-dehydrogenase 3 [Protopterus annectens]|uniref:testosterone 17-beta-dehydrogenase 3 n=1 Tax=Protopterus annectens TaxID=7888 RepID=UPI001CFB938B|nr:testosterone 17-beta-dehydrogenase 3 [Protopterus annectens]